MMLQDVTVHVSLITSDYIIGVYGIVNLSSQCLQSHISSAFYKHILAVSDPRSGRAVSHLMDLDAGNLMHVMI